MIEIRHALTNDDGESLVLLLELCDQYLSIFANEMANQVILTKLTDEMLERLVPGSTSFTQPVKLRGFCSPNGSLQNLRSQF